MPQWYDVGKSFGVSILKHGNGHVEVGVEATLLVAKDPFSAEGLRLRFYVPEPQTKFLFAVEALGIGYFGEPPPNKVLKVFVEFPQPSFWARHNTEVVPSHGSYHDFGHKDSINGGGANPSFPMVDPLVYLEGDVIPFLEKGQPPCTRFGLNVANNRPKVRCGGSGGPLVSGEPLGGMLPTGIHLLSTTGLLSVS